MAHKWTLTPFFLTPFFLSDGFEVKATAVHRFLTGDGEWISALRLQAGQTIATADGSNTLIGDGGNKSTQSPFFRVESAWGAVA